MPDVEIRHFHVFCGLGGGARGFNRGQARIGTMAARFSCIGGIDNDPAAVRDFGRLAGVPGTCLDLFDRDQYCAFHGHEPGPDWREATPADVRRAAGGERPHIGFLSAPCLPANGMVLTETGARPISSVSAGDRVLSHRGRLCHVERVNRRAYSGDMVGLRLNGTVDVQWFTDEHPIWVRHVAVGLAVGQPEAGA